MLQERDNIVRWTNLVDIFCGLTFYPLEHIAWARDKKLLHGKSDKLWDWSLYCWIGSLIACIVRDLWLLRKLHQQEKNKSLSRSEFFRKCYYLVTCDKLGSNVFIKVNWNMQSF